MTNTILITGATGLIGFRILLAALAAGHNVRFTARSETKARTVSANPAVQKMLTGNKDGNRLSSAIIPDLTVVGAFDTAMKGVTHVIHAGSPVPKPTYDPTTEIFQATIGISSNILLAALKTPTVRRVVITSSIVCNLPLGPLPPTTTPVSACDRVPLPEPLPSSFDDVFSGYIYGKVVEMHQSDEFAKKQQPHFTISHVVPGYVFGRNELMLDAEMMRSQNSSNNFMVMGMTGGELPFPIHGAFAHIDDVAETHLKVAFLESEGPHRDFGIATKIDYGSIFDIVHKAFPKATAAGIFKRGSVPTLPVAYDSSDVEQLLGHLRTFEDAVIDVAGQYLEKLGLEKA
ncbi:putative cinnamoyl-CoA reductase [Xylaria sp. FL1777]|nr:putative cinnamoyl-CoA reductase [Xylaria sp. FL1777]